MFTRFGADEEKLMKIRESTLKITKGWDRDEVRKVIEETLTDIIEPLIYEEAADLIDFHLAQGDEVWIVSMSPADVVEPFAELLGITGAIASKARVDEHNCFTGDLDFFAQGPNKAVAMRELAAARGLDLAECFAYSDSETDIPMLEAVGHPYAVNPDKALAKLAHERDWPVLSFTHPVTASRRARSHTPFFVSAIAVAAMAIAGGLRSRRR
jgi:HAD superfamily hydrolase (TIGR01490 family)